MTAKGQRLTWEVVPAPGVELPERPVWNATTGCLIWVDINAGQLHQLCAGQLGAEAGDSVIATAGVAVGAAAPRAGGGYVLAAADGFRLITADGAADGPPLRPAGMPECVRFNDGACDPAGRFWAGTYATDGQKGTGSLYRLDPDGTVTEVLRGITESNGLAWGLDATVFYYTDSGEEISRVREFRFDLAAGTLGEERDLVRFGPADAVADGLVVDADGCLWIAMWGGGCVRRYSADGELMGLYPVPVSQPTCPGFGGPGLDELYLTTAWEGLDTARRAAEPLAGRLLRTRPGVRGLPVACYGG
ncbi:MAG: SMP-30/gluconolactonase/LRE family protein [Streptosporangiaceae bacterium]